MADPVDDPKMPEEVTPEPLDRALGSRYLQYALSTIMHRALPDARDGLKPVQRRILFAMRELGLDARGGFRKSAKIAGDVMGNWHPHGDAAIYDAMARLAQDFVVRYPLVQGQGNFGNIDGDRPAASRYTEARLTEAAEALLQGLTEDAVDFGPNYDGTAEEPLVLPAALPNLLANGASGIAVGMATNIPPHNLDELCAACLHVLKTPDARDETLSELIPGPDFPTGGVIVEPPAAIAEAYRTGRGGIRLRARWAVEELPRGQWQIVVTEIPWQVQKSRLVAALAALIEAKKAPLLADIRDESAEDVRIVLEPRARTVEPEALMATLFRQSELETRFALNMNVLIDGRVPKLCSLREVLRAFLDHRRDVLLRRSRHRLGRIDHRLEVLEGQIVAFLNLDRVIAIIRAEDEPKPVLMAEFALSEVQAESILNTRLRSLRRLEETALRQERDDLLVEREGIEGILVDDDAQWARIGDEIRDIRRRFGKEVPGGARRTGFATAEAVDLPAPEAMLPREPLTVVCSRMGWIRALKGHLGPDSAIRYKDGDEARFVIHTDSATRLLLVASNGRAYTLDAGALPGGRGMGEPVRLMIDLPNEAGIVALLAAAPGLRLLLASSAGDGFVLPGEAALALTRAGKQVLNLRDGATATVCRPIVPAHDHVAVVGKNRKVLVFPLDEMPEMARGKGVRLQRYRDGGLSDAMTFALADGLSWQDPAGRTRSQTDLAEWLGRRASAGRMAPRGFPRDNRFP
jgi:topoisomerase IV subunit A